MARGHGGLDGDPGAPPPHAPTPARPRLITRVRRSAFVALIAVLGVATLVSVAIAQFVGRPDAALMTRFTLAHVAAFLVMGAVALLVARRSTKVVESVFQQEDKLMLAVAHEVRSPLSRMLVALDEGSSGDLVPDAAMKQAMGQGEALAELIDDLLETARVMSGALPMPSEEVRLDEVSTRIVHTGSFGAATVELDLEPHTVVGSPRLMRRAVSNLVRNAAQHAYSAGPGSIRVQVRAGGVVVEDDGPGVPEEKLDALRYETPLKHRTSGLGLGLTGWVAELHGGRLVLANRPDGAGFRAHIELPTQLVGDMSGEGDDVL